MRKLSNEASEGLIHIFEFVQRSVESMEKKDTELLREGGVSYPMEKISIPHPFWSEKARRSLLNAGLVKMRVKGNVWNNGSTVMTPAGIERAHELQARLALAR